MRIDEILIKINNNEITDGAIFHGGDYFYYIIVSDKKLYYINESIKQLVLVDSKDIGRMMNEKILFYQYKKVID